MSAKDIDYRLCDISRFAAYRTSNTVDCGGRCETSCYCYTFSGFLFRANRQSDIPASHEKAIVCLSACLSACLSVCHLKRTSVDLAIERRGHDFFFYI